MRNLKFLLLLASALLMIVLFSGCQFDYEESMMAEDLAEEVPDTVLRSFSQVMVRDSSPRFYIRAEESLSYGKRKETIFKGVQFQEYDETGAVVTDGRAENAKLYNETESVELWGSLNFYSRREAATLEGEYLYWDNEKSTLSGRKDDRISIIETGGSEISGKGFFADSSTKSIRFESEVSGTWSDE